MNMAPDVGSVSVCSSGSRFSSSSRLSRRSSAGAASGAANGSLDRPVRRRDVIRPMNITTTAAAAAAVAEGGSGGSAMAAVELLPSASGGDGSSSSDGRNDFEKSTLAGVVLSVYRSSLLRDRRAAASNADEEEKGETTTAMPSPVTPPRDQQKQQQQQLQNRRPAIPSRTGRDPDEIVRGKSRSKLLTRRRSGTGLDDGNDNITAAATLFLDPPGEEPSIFPIVKLDIIGSAVSNRALPSSTTAMVLRRRRDAEPSTIDDAELFESSETSFGISSDSLDLSKDDFNCSNGSGSNNNNNNNNSNNRRRRRRSTSCHHRNSNVNVVRWVDTKNINNIAEVDVRVLKRYANSFVMARVQEDEDKMATTTTTIRGIDPDEDIVFSSSSSGSSSALDRHQPTTTTNTNNIVNEEEVQAIITNSRLRIATISCGFKRSNYFVREDLDTRIYFSSIEDALGYMSVRGYSKMFGEEELEWRELFRRAHGVVKIGKNKHKQRYRKGKLVMILKKSITDDDYVDGIAKKTKQQHKRNNEEEGGDDFTTSCTTLTIAETERTSLGKSVRGPYKSYSEKFIAIQENLKRQCLLAIMEGRSLSDVDYYHGNGDNDDDGGGMLLLTNGPTTDSSSSIRGPVDPDPDINPTRRLTIASRSTYASNNHSSSNKSKSVNDVVTWKSGVAGGSVVSMSRSRATTIGGVNSAPGVLEQVNDEMTKAPSVALGSARRGTYGGGVRYFTPDNSFYKSEGGTQSDTEENEERSDYDEEDDDEEYEEDEDKDDEADNSMSDNGTLVINEEGTCVSSLGNFTSKSSEEDESSTNSTIASYVIDERSGSADTRYRPYVKDVKTTKNKSNKKKEKKSKKEKTKSR